ncbi:hypothetical protein [Streptomyces sp. NBC_00483]|uniref:hypothetical protein n=1 Tax=Streptomyces sp. NBC_00483 TaxID=2975756 RepID=UPI002E1771A9
MPQGPPSFPQQQMPPGGPVPPPAPSSGKGRGVASVLLAVLGVPLLLGGGALAAHAYSNSRQTIANTSYGKVLWRNETADAVLPDTVGGRASYDGPLTNPKHAEWRRLGLSDDTSCAAGLTGKTRKKAAELKCEAVLRATYVDPTGNQVATVVVVVLPAAGGDAETSAKKRLRQFFEDQGGVEGAVNVLPVKGTLAARWSNDRRGAAELTSVSGDSMPYAVGVTLGAVDGTSVANLPGSFGEPVNAGIEDRESWQGDAEDLAFTFINHLSDLQMAGAK